MVFGRQVRPVVDDVGDTVRYIVVDTGGWLAERKVLLSPIAFRAMDWAHQRITAALTKAVNVHCAAHAGGEIRSQLKP